MSLNLGQLRTRVERLLQDTDNRRWTDAEINDYIFDSQHEFVRLTGYPLLTTNVDLQGLVAEYDVPTDLMDIQRARVRNRAVEIPIISPTVLDESSTFLNESVDADWRSQTGPVRAVVLDHQSASKFRLYPIPAGNIVSTVTASFDATTTSIVVSDASDLTVGMYVGGNSNIPEKTAIGAISGTTITLTKTTTNTVAVSNASVTFVSSNVFSNYLLQTPTTDVDAISGTDLLFDSSGFFQGTSVVLPSIEFQGTREPYRTSIGTADRVMTGTFSGSSTSVTVTSTGTLSVGMHVYGAGIPAGTTISALPDATTITLSGNTSSAGTDVSLTFSSDSDVPIIGARFHEALVFGAVERAYLKENELRNVQKSGAFRERFLQFVAEARREEHENRIRRVGGANRVRMKVSRRWI